MENLGMERKKQIKILIFWGLGAIALAGGIVFYMLFPDSVRLRPNVKVYNYVKISVAKTRCSNIDKTFPGVVQASKRVNLFFRVSGPIIEINVAPGDKVVKGQILMKIDPRDYKKKLLCAKNALVAALARIKAMKTGARPEDKAILQKELEAAKAKLEELLLDYKRIAGLYRARAVSKAQFDRSKSEYIIAKANIEVLKQKLRIAEKGARAEDIAAAEAECRQLYNQVSIAEDQLKDTVLKAPFDGIITRQYIENHEMALQGVTVLGINDISHIDIAIDLPEEIMHKLDKIKDMKCKIRFPAIPDEYFEAQVCEWSIDADHIAKTYEVILGMPQPKKYKILPGMAVEVSGNFSTTKNNQNCVSIPSSSLVSKNNGKTYVWVVNANNRVSQRAVKTGQNIDAENVLILAGLKPGEKVVSSGANFITPKMLVKNLKSIEFGEKK